MNVTSEAKSGLVGLFVAGAVLSTTQPTPTRAEEVANPQDQLTMKDGDASAGRFVNYVMSKIDEGTFVINPSHGMDGKLLYTQADGSQKTYTLLAVPKFNIDIDFPPTACAIFSDGEGEKMHINAVCVFGWQINSNAADVTPIAMGGYGNVLKTREQILIQTAAQTEPSGGFLVFGNAGNEIVINRGQSDEQICRHVQDLSLLSSGKVKQPDAPASALDYSSCYVTQAAKPLIRTVFGRNFG